MSQYSSILLVEDDAALALWISEYLESENYSVTHIERGDLVEPTVRSGSFDIVLLDLMLPGMDGIEVCRTLRRFNDIPVIILTARVDEFDEVIGLEVGANDYVTKPVRPRALLARIKSQLRSGHNPTEEKNQQMQFGTFCIDRSAKRVVLNGSTIELSSGLFEFLWLLASKAGHVVSREEVFQVLKGREYDGLDRRFDVMVSSLRKLLDDDPQQPQRIKTVWGRGYLFVKDAW